MWPGGTQSSLKTRVEEKEGGGINRKKSEILLEFYKNKIKFFLFEAALKTSTKPVGSPGYPFSVQLQE